MPEERPDSKSKLRADRALVAVYHEAKLADLVEHVRAGLARYDASEITAFDGITTSARVMESAGIVWT